MNHSYLFTLRHHNEGNITVDVYWNVTDWEVQLVKDKVLNVNDFSRRIAHELRGLSLRLRFNADMTGPYLVHFSEPLPIEQLEKYINDLPADHRKRFLEEAQTKTGF